jgi:hypothetical protein
VLTAIEKNWPKAIATRGYIKFPMNKLHDKVSVEWPVNDVQDKIKTTHAVSVKEVENSETLPKSYPIIYPQF